MLLSQVVDPDTNAARDCGCRITQADASLVVLEKSADTLAVVNATNSLSKYMPNLEYL